MTAPLATLRLHHFPLSGHAHRAQLMLSLLDLPHQLVHVNMLKGAHKQPEYLTLNPFGQVPVLEDGDLVLADSAAILHYLAHRYDPSGQWWPRDPVVGAQVQRWLSVAAGPLVQGPGNARVAVLFGRQVEPRMHEIAAQLFKVMDAHLARQGFLATDATPTVADIALYTYTAHAPEGGISLEPYAHIRRWLQAIEALPRFVGMPRSPVPAPGLNA